MAVKVNGVVTVHVFLSYNLVLYGFDMLLCFSGVPGCKLAKFSACRAKCMTTIAMIKIYIFTLNDVFAN